MMSLSVVDRASIGLLELPSRQVLFQLCDDFSFMFYSEVFFHRRRGGECVHRGR